MPIHTESLATPRCFSSFSTCPHLCGWRLDKNIHLCPEKPGFSPPFCSPGLRARHWPHSGREPDRGVGCPCVKEVRAAHRRTSFGFKSYARSVSVRFAAHRGPNAAAAGKEVKGVCRCVVKRSPTGYCFPSRRESGGLGRSRAQGGLRAPAAAEGAGDPRIFLGVAVRPYAPVQPWRASPASLQISHVFFTPEWFPPALDLSNYGLLLSRSSSNSRSASAAPPRPSSAAAIFYLRLAVGGGAGSDAVPPLGFAQPMALQAGAEPPFLKGQEGCGVFFLLLNSCQEQFNGGQLTVISVIFLLSFNFPH